MFESCDDLVQVLADPFLARINRELEEVMPGMMLLGVKWDIEHLVHDDILAENRERCDPSTLLRAGMGDERCDIISKSWKQRRLEC
jgi:hypothetical protein